MAVRAVGVFLFSLLIVMLSASFVSADVASFFQDDLPGYVNPVTKFLLGDASDGLLFVKLLVFLILMSVVYMTARKIPMIGDGDGWVLWVVTLAISILSVRFLTTDALIELVWLPSGVLGIAFMCLFPLVLYFFFVKDVPSRTIRRFAWVFFIVIYMTMAIVRWDSLSQDFNIAGSGRYWNLAWIYIFTAGIATLSLIFDKTIQSSFKKIHAENAESIAQNHVRIDLTDEFNKVRNNYLSTGSTMTKAAYNAHLTSLANRAKAAKLHDLESIFKAAKV
jgi:hypothetical protein